MRPFLFVFAAFFIPGGLLFSQAFPRGIDSFELARGVQVAIDAPDHWRKNGKTVLVLYALPNGNTLAQTMGKKLASGDDWHYDIQHILAQTAFIRKQQPKWNWVVIYLGNRHLSWPAWKMKYPDYTSYLPFLVDSLTRALAPRKRSVYLNGHSGGGSFIFGYLEGLRQIPTDVERIGFLDSNYGYDSTFYPKLRDWLAGNRKARLTVFAYNDSVALYNGKPLLSPTGGTWYRSRLMLRHLRQDFSFQTFLRDSLECLRSGNGQCWFFLKPNPGRGIYHTQIVEFNGFIHSVFCGTRRDGKRYRYFGKRVYEDFIR